MKNSHYIILFFILFISACATDESSLGLKESIQLSVSKSAFRSGTTLSTIVGSDAENEIDNLYIFLFSATADLKKYYMSTSDFSDGVWSEAEGKITINLSPSSAGEREVYIVANCSSALKTALDGVDDKSDFETIYNNLLLPWSPQLTTPILMVGNRTHDFNMNSQLNAIDLERAVAKLRLNITLSSKQQSIPVVKGVAQYQYRYVDFDKRTYVIKPAVKPDNLTTSVFIPWASADYELDNSTGKVVSLTVTTYLNERDTSGAMVEILLPYITDGFLPPPEFGDEIYKLRLPKTIVRNTLYEYDITL